MERDDLYGRLGAGGIFGYVIGAFLFEPLARPIIDFYHYGPAFEQLQQWFADYGLLIVFVAGFTPVPYKVFTITSGFAGLSLPVFIIGSVISRGARFFSRATLLYFSARRSAISSKSGSVWSQSSLPCC